jgi:hypothetical protein
VLLVVCALAGCRAQPPPRLNPSPAPLVVAYSPALRPWLPALQTCIQEQPDYALLVDETLDPSLVSAGTDLALRLGEPPAADGFTALLGQESLAVVVHPANPVRKLTTGQLGQIFSGKIDRWDDLGGKSLSIQPWVYLSGDPLRQIFDSVVSHGKPVSPLARLAVDPSIVLAQVAEDPGAIGYLPQSWLSGAVRSLETDPDVSAALQLPLIVQTTSPPSPPLRKFLACLQSAAASQ